MLGGYGNRANRQVVDRKSLRVAGSRRQALMR